jgi:hypothetical protein
MDDPARFQRRRRQAQAASRAAETSARTATRCLLGTAAAARSRWAGHGDGTADGTVDGLCFHWSPRPDATQLTLVRRCRSCNAGWSMPVPSVSRLRGALVEDRCRRCHWGAPAREAQVG